MKDKNASAFPFEGTNGWLPELGLSKREWFSGMAMQGWIAGLGDTLGDFDDEDEAFAEHQAAVAKAAFGYADAMLKEAGEHE